MTDEYKYEPDVETLPQEETAFLDNDIAIDDLSLETVRFLRRTND